MISIIIPAHNEEIHILQNIQIIKDTLAILHYENEIILVDDGSYDDTYLILQQLADKDEIKLLRKISSQGKGAAIKTGWKFINQASEYILILDADLQIKPIEIKTFFKQMEHWDADVVVGDKKHDYSNVEYTFKRKIISWGYNTMIRLLFGLSLRDTQCGLKLFKRVSLDLIMDKILVKQFAFDLEILVSLKANNIRVAFAPVYVAKRLNNGSATFKNIMQTAKDTLAVWFRYQKGWYNKK